MGRFVQASIVTLLACMGCVGTSTGPTIDEAALLHGPNIWAAVQPKIRVQEHIPVHPGKADISAKSQTRPAPYRPGEPEEGATHPLTVERVAVNLLADLKAAYPLADGEPGAKELEELELPARDIQMHARELVLVFERRAQTVRALEGLTEAKRQLWEEEVAGNDANLQAEMAALDEWSQVAARIERAADWLVRGAALRSPEGVKKGWASLLDAGRSLPQLRAGIDLLMLKKK
jgi:hypothetical protein